VFKAADAFFVFCLLLDGGVMFVVAVVVVVFAQCLLLISSLSTTPRSHTHKKNTQAVLTLEQPWGYANASVAAAPQDVWLEWVKTNWYVALRAAFVTAGTHRWEVKYTTPSTGAQTQRVFRCDLARLSVGF
jgi:hypothetical protein